MSKPDLVNVESLFEKSMSDTLEGMAFLEVELCEKLSSLPGFKEDDWITRISITEPFEAYVNLIFDDDFANDLVENITGETEKITEKMVGDALSEIANTAVGHLAGNLLGGESDFSLGLPESTRGQFLGSILSISRKPTILNFQMAEGKVLGIFETPDDVAVKVN